MEARYNLGVLRRISICLFVFTVVGILSLTEVTDFYRDFEQPTIAVTEKSPDIASLLGLTKTSRVSVIIVVHNAESIVAIIAIYVHIRAT